MENHHSRLTGESRHLSNTAVVPPSQEQLASPKELGLRIKTARKKMRMSQVGLAKALGVSRTAVAAWEAGLSKPEMNRFSKLAAALGTTDYALLFGCNSARGKTTLLSAAEFGKIILAARKEAQMTQVSLAKRLGLTRTSIGSWEAGKSRPEWEQLQPLAGALDLPLVDLLFGHDPQLSGALANPADTEASSPLLAWRTNGKSQQNSTRMAILEVVSAIVAMSDDERNQVFSVLGTLGIKICN